MHRLEFPFRFLSPRAQLEDGLRADLISTLARHLPQVHERARGVAQTGLGRVPAGAAIRLRCADSSPGHPQSELRPGRQCLRVPTAAIETSQYSREC